MVVINTKEDPNLKYNRLWYILIFRLNLIRVFLKILKLMRQISYANLKLSLVLLFYIFVSNGLFLFLTLTMPQLIGIQITNLYYSIISTITPIIWLPIIFYLKRKSGIQITESVRFPGIKLIFLLVILVVSTKIIASPLFDPIEYITNLIDGRIKREILGGMEVDLNIVIKLIGVVLIVPIFEEIIWRNQIFGLLLKKHTLLTAVLLSSILFAIMHLQFSKLGGLFIWGVLFSLVYYQTKSLVASIMLHSLCNLQDFFTKQEFFVMTDLQIFRHVSMLLGSVTVIIFIIKYLGRYRTVKMLNGAGSPNAT